MDSLHRNIEPENVIQVLPQIFLSCITHAVHVCVVDNATLYFFVVSYYKNMRSVFVVTFKEIYQVCNRLVFTEERESQSLLAAPKRDLAESQIPL